MDNYGVVLSNQFYDRECIHQARPKITNKALGAIVPGEIEFGAERVFRVSSLALENY